MGSSDTGRKGPRYVVVTPAFNEQQHVGETIQSMIAQTCRPLAWVLVDDRSSDGTWDIIADSTTSQRWIHGIQRVEDLPPNADGLLLASEARAFLDGLKLALAQFPEPDYIVKLDADLRFGPDYFESLFVEFEKHPSLGISGGSIYYQRANGTLVKERVRQAHVRGATKVYRRKCYEDIGGLRPILGWDAVDELLAKSKGWQAWSCDPPMLIHLRPTASRDGRFKGFMRNGRMTRYVGFSFWRTLLRVGYRAFLTLDPVQAAGLFCGYYGDWIRRRPRIDDREIRDAVRRYQWM